MSHNNRIQPKIKHKLTQSGPKQTKLTQNDPQRAKIKPKLNTTQTDLP